MSPYCFRITFPLISRRFNEVRLNHADGSPEYRALHHELGSAVAAFGPEGAVSVEHASPGEGFVHGLLLLAGELAHATRPAHVTAPEPEAALAS